jgi:hypothetical protein
MGNKQAQAATIKEKEEIGKFIINYNFKFSYQQT